MFLKHFIQHLRFEKRQSEHSVTAYQTDLLQFEAFLRTLFPETQGDVFSLAEKNIIRAWIAELHDTHIENRSINRKVSALKTFYKFLMREGKLKTNPTDGVVAPKFPKKLPPVLPSTALNHLLDQPKLFGEGFAGIRNRLTVELLYGTGMRLSELIGLKITDINTANSSIRVLGKGNKERLIPIHPNLVKLIQEYTAMKRLQSFEYSSDRLIVTDKGQKVYPMFVQRLCDRYLSLVSSQSNRNPHVLRHSFATDLLNEGAELNAIKELLGHANLAATQVYTHNSISRLKSVYKTAHPRA